MLEVLAAMTILAILGAALFTMFNQAAGTWQRAGSRTEQFLAAREALGLMASEIRQAIVAPNAAAGTPGAQFYGFDKDSGPAPPWRKPDVPGDWQVHPDCGQVYFVAPTEMRKHDPDPLKDSKQDICVIGYWVKEETPGEPGTLMRYCLSDNESAWSHLDPSADDEDWSQPLGINVRELTFEFWEHDNDTWDNATDEWVSDKDQPPYEEQFGTVPRAVRITLVVEDPMGKEKAKEFRTVVYMNNWKKPD